MALAKFLIIKPEAMNELYWRGLSYNVSLRTKFSYILGILQLFDLPEIFPTKHSNLCPKSTNLLAFWVNLAGKGQEKVFIRTKKNILGFKCPYKEIRTKKGRRSTPQIPLC